MMILIKKNRSRDKIPGPVPKVRGNHVLVLGVQNEVRGNLVLVPRLQNSKNKELYFNFIITVVVQPVRLRKG